MKNADQGLGGEEGARARRPGAAEAFGRGILPTEAMSLKRLEKALLAGADPNRCRRAGEGPRAASEKLAWTPLLHAIRNEKELCVKRLLQAGANPQMPSADGLWPLTLACMVQNAAIARQLLGAGADHAAPFAGQSPLISAIKEGALECVEALLEFGADANQADRYGQGPLTHAAHEGREKIAYALARAGARWDERVGERQGREWAAKNPAVARAIDQGFAEFEARELSLCASNGAVSAPGKALRV